MKYKEYEYRSEIDRDEDCVKIWHYAVGPDKTEVSFPVSPYEDPSQELFEAWIDAGMPARFSREDFRNNLRNDDVALLRSWI